MLLNSPYITGSLTATGNTVISGSLYAVGSNVVLPNQTYIRSYQNDSINIGTNVIGQIPTTDGNGVNIEYLIKSNTNYRTGNIMGVWDGSDVQFAEITTVDLGDTTPIVITLDISSGNVRILATASSTGWIVKVLAKIL